MKGHKEIVDFLTGNENSRGTQNSENGNKYTILVKK